MELERPGRMSEAEFLEWNRSTEGRYELIDYTVVKLMAGAKESHRTATNNLTVALTLQLRGSGCRSSSSDGAVRTGEGRIRYPDVVVDCAPPDADRLVAGEPQLVAEVLSPTNLASQVMRKLDEYRAHPDIRYVLVIEPDIVNVAFYERSEEGWRDATFTRLDDVIELPALGVGLKVAEIYEELTPKTLPDLRVV